MSISSRHASRNHRIRQNPSTSQSPSTSQNLHASPDHNYRRSLRLVLLESAVTAGSVCTPILTPFFHSINLSQAQIATTQALFTIIVLLIDFPTGWLADRFGRKWANVIGDFGAALAYFLYATTNSFLGVVCCECLLGFFVAFSEGVDLSLLKHFSGKLESSEDYFRQQTARLSFWQQVCGLVLILLGGPIGAISFRLAIACSGLTRLIGGVISLGIQDDSERLKTTTVNPLQDMTRIARFALQNRPLRLCIFAYAVGREMTHGIIWVFTPMLMLAGVPVGIVSMGWAASSLFCIVGTRLAGKFSPRLSDRQILAVPLILMTISMTILTIQINIWTVGFYLLMGVVQGWTGATLMPRVQQYVPASEQTSVISFAKVIAQALYVPAVYLIGLAADVRLNYAATATLAIFLPLGLLILHSFKK